MRPIWTKPIPGPKAWRGAELAATASWIVTLGPADIDSGALYRSPERQQAYDAGTFKPTEALIVWPRHAMLAWAAGHEDLRDDRSARRPMLSPHGARA